MTPIELIARREALGLSQGLLAHRLGVEQNTVSRWEHGQRQIPAGVNAELRALEKLVDHIVDNAVTALEAVASENTPPILFAYRDNQDLWAAIPELDGLPAAAHRVALARALTEYDSHAQIHEKP